MKKERNKNKKKILSLSLYVRILHLLKLLLCVFFSLMPTFYFSLFLSLNFCIAFVSTIWMVYVCVYGIWNVVYALIIYMCIHILYIYITHMHNAQHYFREPSSVGHYIYNHPTPLFTLDDEKNNLHIHSQLRAYIHQSRLESLSPHKTNRK